MAEKQKYKRNKYKIPKPGIRIKLFFLILVMGAASVALFGILWKNQGNIAAYLEQTGMIVWFDADEFVDRLEKSAKNYTVPESEEDTGGREEIEEFLKEFADRYTGVSIYGRDDGLYRCGKAPVILNQFILGSVLSNSNLLLGEEHGDVPVEFANGTYDVIYYSYHKSKFTYPYLIISILVCTGVFLAGILIFMGRAMKRIFRIKDAIIQMSQGDLKEPVPYCGTDEIGIVAGELDSLRQTLDENLRQERDSRRANQDLITAMSHDLRTPLTVLYGYLEVLKRKKDAADMREEYIDRCLKKTEDIRALTDRMFEYALVYEENEAAELRQIPASVLTDCLKENCDFIRLAGFHTETLFSPLPEVMTGDEIMLKRICSNLFSNILKYGDKRGEVIVRAEPEQGKIKITVSNQVREGVSDTESNRIGLRSAEKMAEIHGGEVHTFLERDIYTVQVVLGI